jgi:hypothetical protein
LKARTLALAALSVLLLQPLAFAQTYRGSIRGTVTDQAGAVIVNAAVKVTNLETNEARTAASDGEGEYALSSLAPGRYSVEISSANFKSFSREIALRVNQEIRLDALLPVAGINAGDDFGSPSEPMLKQESAALGTVVSEHEIRLLPLDGRNFLELALLAPGAAPAAAGSAGSVRGDFAFNVNGAREDSNNFLLDGVYNVDP